ncbi:GNAT family N-acetyltransferase [Gordonia sp. OPL2]|uniref:N-acetylglutamate synthase, CG3035 family n=1 Tax=Gordonia sp. OPL2 TaxID=2486274 RepID=UPI0016562758|nr:GNAT family N-acetyltransferase [Gordonia sp. OPL2]ROZ99363.1 GNAT family N-acetyltransferase [Gordonia sp. OPL2]
MTPSGGAGGSGARSSGADSSGAGGTDPFVGDRIVVRYRLGDATPDDWRGDRAAALSDVTGILLDDGDPLVVERDGAPESIPRSAVTSVRLLSRVTVRNSEIRSAEVAAAAAWPGAESAMLSGWLLRAGHGFTRRANSAVPVEFGAGTDADTLAALREWYAARGLPALVVVADRLIPAGQIDGTERSGDVQFLTREIADFPAAGSDAVRLDDAPTAAWLRAYRGDDVDLDSAAAVVGASRGPLTAATVGDDTPVSIGRATVTESADGTPWLGITALWTAPDHRRRGLASDVMASLVGWGADHGAQRIYVQVEADNRVAGTWYRTLGFGLHHSYRYVEV